MDLTILRKKINSYRTPKGRITRIPDELLGEILYAWEQWTGPASAFYKEIGADYRKMGSLMGRAKKLKREGAFDGVDFAEVKVIDHNVNSVSLRPVTGIEIVWANKHTIRFPQVDDLIYFLNRVESPKKINIVNSDESHDEAA